MSHKKRGGQNQTTQQKLTNKNQPSKSNQTNPGDLTADTLSDMRVAMQYNATSKVRICVTQLHSADQDQVCYKHFHKPSIGEASRNTPSK